MPELPEVETVRAGLERWVVGRTIEAAAVTHARAVRRHPTGAEGFEAQVAGRKVVAALRRGKYLWLPLDDGQAVVGHLGMSGQLLVVPAESDHEKHLRIRFGFSDGGRELRFVDQRTFGGLHVDRLVNSDPDPLDASGLSTVDVDGGIPVSLAHIAPDPLEAVFSDDQFVTGIRARRTGVKRALLDQTLISGVGNIYADEALWRARLHYARPTETLTRPVAALLLAELRAVLTEALVQGGTSFDSLYVDINGESGYFDRSLNAYGRVGKPCPRCGTAIRRDPFMNRSSFTCPQCQPRPRRGRW